MNNLDLIFNCLNFKKRRLVQYIYVLGATINIMQKTLASLTIFVLILLFPVVNGVGQKQLRNKKAGLVFQAIEIEVVEIPAGSFLMGSENNNTEMPVHRVNISKCFFIGKYEITQSQWKAIMGTNLSYFPTCGDDCPVESVTWDEVKNFIKKINDLQTDYQYRLPTEAEWEYACRAGTTGDYYGDLDSIGWYSGNSGRTTHPVGKKQPNRFGLYDITGNVFEWCEDLYSDYQSETVTDPTGGISGPDRVARGGGWYAPASNLRSAYRSRDTHSNVSYGIGFRLVRY